MEIVFNTSTSEFVWVGENITWTGYDRINNQYLYTTGLGFTKLNSLKNGYETLRSISNLWKLASWSANESDPILIITEGLGLFKYWWDTAHWQYIWGNVRDGFDLYPSFSGLPGIKDQNLIWDATYMSSEHKIMAIQSLESLEHADKTVTVALTIYYFETDMLCNSCVRYEDAGGDLYLEALAGEADPGAEVIELSVGETYAGHYIRSEDALNINGRPYYVNWDNQTLLAWDVTAYSILDKSCLGTIQASHVNGTPFSADCVLEQASNNSSNPDTSLWTNPGSSRKYTITRKTGNSPSATRSPTISGTPLFVKKWMQDLEGTARAICWFRLGDNEYFSLADSANSRVYSWDPNTKEPNWTPAASFTHPHTTAASMAISPTVYSISHVQNSGWLIYNSEWTYYILEFDPITNQFNRPEVMDNARMLEPFHF
jgi:hypothetical protein